MKRKAKEGVLTKLVVILLIIFISVISFLGIHNKNLNSWKSIIPDFILAKDLGEARTFIFEVSKDTEEVEVEATSETENAEQPATTEAPEATEEVATADATEATEDATTEEANAEAETEPTTTQVPVNKLEDLNAKNYRKAKSIIEKRLQGFGINDETVTVDETTGNITVIVPHSQAADFVVDLVKDSGVVEIIDSDTKEVLINNDQISKVTTGYNESRQSSATEGNYLIDIGIQLEFTGKGLDKLNEISHNYIEYTDESGNPTQKTITVQVNGEDRYRTYFDPEGNYSSIFVPIYSSVDAEDTKTFNQNYNDCVVMQSAINGGIMPIHYEISAGTYMSSNLGENFVRNAVIVIAVILCALAIYIILKYGKDGLMVAIIELGYVAILALLLRIASVTITFIGLITILLMAFLNYYLAVAMIEKDKVEHFAKFLRRIVPLLVAIVVFVFATDINAKTMGMIGFWSLIGYVYTFLVSLVLFKNDEKEGAKKHE